MMGLGRSFGEVQQWCYADARETAVVEMARSRGAKEGRHRLALRLCVRDTAGRGQLSWEDESTLDEPIGAPAWARSGLWLMDSNPAAGAILGLRVVFMGGMSDAVPHECLHHIELRGCNQQGGGGGVAQGRTRPSSKRALGRATRGHKAVCAARGRRRRGRAARQSPGSLTDGAPV